MNPSLASLHILVTRPKPQGKMLCEKIRELGGDPIYFPTIEIKSIPCSAPTKHYDWVVFVSPQAVYHGAHLLKDPLPNIAAVGAGTAKLLEEMHLPVTLFPATEWSSEGLLNLSEFQQCQGKNIAIVKGEGGRDHLSSQLRARGAIIDHLDVYQRLLPTQPNLKLLTDQKIDIIVCTSGDGLQNLLILWKDAVHQPLLVVSQRIAELARQLGFKEVHVANNASHEEIIRGIMHATR